MIEETDGEIEVTNQIDRVVEKEVKEKYGIEKKFSKKLKSCNKSIFMRAESDMIRLFIFLLIPIAKREIIWYNRYVCLK